MRIFFGTILVAWLVYLARTGWTRNGSILDIPSAKPWPKVAFFTHLGWHAAAWASIPLCIGGLALSGWWAQRPTASSAPEKAGLSPQQRWFFGLSAVLAVGLALFNGLPRMGHPLWGDEFATFRVAVGDFKSTARNPEPKFFRRSLEEAAYWYEKPNNHQLFSVLGHLAHKKLGGTNKKDPTRPWFSEWKFRLPAFIAAVLSLPALGWLFVRLGQPQAGMLAMPLWALHPWFVRYASEARGYGLCFLLVPASLLLLLASLQSGKRRHWLAFGLCLALLLLAYFGTLFFVLLTGVAALVVILGQPSERRRSQFGGLALATIVALLLWLPGFLPCLPGLRSYLPRTQCSEIVRMHFGYVVDEAGFFLTGLRHIPWEIGNPNSQSTADLPLPFWLVAVVALAALGVGIWQVGRNPVTRWLLLPLVAAAPLFFMVSALRNSYLFPWYLCFAVPGLIGLTAVGLTTGISSLLKRTTPPARLPLGVGLAAGVVALFAWQTHGPRTSLRNHPTSPTRETVALYREAINPHRPAESDIVTLGIWGTNQMYDPFLQSIRDLAAFRDTVTAAVAAGQRVVADIGQVEVAREKQPQIMRLLDNPQLFDRQGPFWGARESLNTRWVYTLRDGPALLAAVSAELRDPHATVLPDPVPPGSADTSNAEPLIPDALPSADLAP